MDYYFQIKKPADFRYNIINGIKDCLLIQREKEKLELIRQAKSDLFKEIKDNLKELKNFNNKLENILVDDELKKEIKEEVNKEKEYKESVVIKKIEPKIDTTVKKRDTFLSDQVIAKTNKEIKKEKITEPKQMTPIIKSSDEMKSFEYTLDQIEKKLGELRQL